MPTTFLRRILVSFAFASPPLGITVARAAGAEAALAIAVAPDATHVAGIAGDTITVVKGSTYAFTVDTPEDQGFVATTPDVAAFLREITALDGSAQVHALLHADGTEKTTGTVAAGDRLRVTSADGRASQSYLLELKPLALSGRLTLEHVTATTDTPRDLVLAFNAGQRSPDATVMFSFPAGIEPTLDNTTVNIIGRGDVRLRDLAQQSIGRTGSSYSYTRVGEVALARRGDGGTELTLRHLDLRPANGMDVKLVISGVKLARAGSYPIRARYTTAQPEVLTSAGVGAETATLAIVPTVTDFARVADIARGQRFRDAPESDTAALFSWSGVEPGVVLRLLHSTDAGKTWKPFPAKFDPKTALVSAAGLAPNQLHQFRLEVGGGAHRGLSNVAQFHSGKLDVKSFGARGDGQADDTDAINRAIAHLATLGGGTLLFSDGTYNVRTVHLRSHVWLYVDRGATLLALKGGDAPETTWFSDRKYRSGLSPTDSGPYADPENWLTKQDVGHHYFHNAMFFGERLDNVKIVGTGRISGNGNLVTGDNVMRNAPGGRSDKMFVLKLCTHVEIGGLSRSEDLWYDPEKDAPYYIRADGTKDFDDSTMLHIDRAGHFALLATGTDHIDVHDTYFAKHNTSSVRDIYDFMQCNDVAVTNIYSKVSSDDIVKPGSDCSLGFTRPATHYRVRNIIGDTNCNLFQIGSETADDITDICVDNIYVLGANKAGFSISTNDGAHVKDIHLNCGHTGPLHARSQMRRTRTPFFISISNRGRILGATVARVKFDENGKAHDELLVTNVNIGVVENIILNGIDVAEMYAGSSFGGEKLRWKAFDGKQPHQAPIIAGYKLPDSSVVQGGLGFRLPNGQHTGYIRHVVFNDVHFLAKGGYAVADAARQPPELGVGQYNASNLGILPAYGLWARHVMGLEVTNCSFNHEQPDGTPAVTLDDVVGARFRGVKLVHAGDQPVLVQLKDGARDVSLENVTCYEETWGQAATELPPVVKTNRHVSLPPRAGERDRAK